LIQHIVDTLKSNAAKISEKPGWSQRINKDCRQSANNRSFYKQGVHQPPEAAQRWRHKNTVLECRPHLVVTSALPVIKA
jgi:hypothetical protein